MMVALYLALIGLPVGLVLDALIVRLAVTPDDFDDDDEGEEAPATPAAFLQAERGSLVLESESTARTWLRRALVVGTTCGLFAAAALRFDEPGHVALVASYISVLIVCSGTDLLAYRVPNVITYPAMVGALIVGAKMSGANIEEVLAGGGLGAGVLLVPSLLSGGVGMGMGDVKLLAFAGLALGFTHLVPAMLFMALLGGGVAALLLATGLRKRGQPIPYAPFIAAGAIAAMLWQGTAFVTLT
jgi:prepilin signal peptidase PulO-like enzyme (type II secretory pathway)